LKRPARISGACDSLKGDKLIAPDVEEDVSNAPAFFDVYRVGDYRLEAQRSGRNS
jgi:hypothetical protein